MLLDSEHIDGLPLGILRLEDEQITFANRFLRSLFDGELTTVSALADRYPELEELRAQPENGNASPTWLSINATVFCVVSQTRDNTVEHYFLPGWLISDTAPALKALQGNYDDLIEIFENCFDGIYVADGAGRTLWMNAGFERCYGLSARNFLGRDANMLEREGYLEPLITWKIITTKKRQTALQTTKSGRKVLATGIPLLAADGSVRRVIINSRDTTELIEMQGKLSAAEEEIRNYKSELRQIRETMANDGELVWFSDEMQDIVRLAMHVARTDAAVLIRGGSGIGKRKLAELVFRYSKRNRKRLYRIGFGTMPDSELLVELFGRPETTFNHRESGLLVRSDGGTLILEGVDQMSRKLQERLASWFRDEQTRLRRDDTNVRFVATSQEDLGQMVADGRFREDLYFRLRVAELNVPPLKGRAADIVGLAQHFLDEFNKKHSFEKYFERAAINRLARWPWPGNVRELRAFVERLVVMEPASQLSAKVIDAVLADSTTLAAAPERPQRDLTAADIGDLVRFFEADLLCNQVDRFGSIRKAAKATGISVSTIKRKLAWKKAQSEGSV